MNIRYTYTIIFLSVKPNVRKGDVLCVKNTSSMETWERVDGQYFALPDNELAYVPRNGTIGLNHPLVINAG